MIYNMRRRIIFLMFIFILTMQGPGISHAAENISVAIVPFSMQGMNNKEDYQKIIYDSIIFVPVLSYKRPTHINKAPETIP